MQARSSGTSGSSWTPEEDEALRRLVGQHGVKKWSIIAKELRTKKSKQCRRRWKNYLDADLKTAPWTPEEDATLIRGQKLFGNKWTEIAKLVGGRTDNAVKNRWASLCKKSSGLGVSLSEAAAGASAGSSEDEEGPAASAGPQRARPSQRTARTASGVKRPRPATFVQPEGAPQAAGDESLAAGGAAAAAAEPEVGHPRLQRVGPPSFRHLSIAIPEPPDQPPGEAGSHGSARSGPLSIRVYRDSLSEGERQLAQELNCMAAPVQIVLEPRPMTWDSLRPVPHAGRAATPEAGWDAAGIRGDGSPSDIMKWLATGTPEGSQQGPHSRLSAGGAGPHTPGTPIQAAHRQLLHKLLSKGIDAQNAWSAAAQAASSLGARQPGQPSGRRYHIAVSTSHQSPSATVASPATPVEPSPHGGESPTVEVLVSPTFSSQELQMLLEALGDMGGSEPERAQAHSGPIIRNWMPGPAPSELPISKRPRVQLK